MSAIKTFLSFALLFILCHIPIRCQDEKETTTGDTHNPNTIHSAHTIRDLNQEIRPFSSSDIHDEKKDIFFTGHYHTRIRYFRPKRSVPERSIATIRKRLNEELMSAAHPKMESNDTGLAKEEFIDFSEKHGENPEQSYNKKTSSLYKLHQQQLSEKRNEYEEGIDCDFENNCLWTWRKDIANGYFMTSGAKFGINETGPRVDADGREGVTFVSIQIHTTYALDIDNLEFAYIVSMVIFNSINFVIGLQEGIKTITTNPSPLLPKGIIIYGIILQKP